MIGINIVISINQVHHSKTLSLLSG